MIRSTRNDRKKNHFWTLQICDGLTDDGAVTSTREHIVEICQYV